MIVREVTVNGSTYKITITSQVINQVNRLNSLYASAYQDPEEFEQISSEISGVIADIAGSVEPAATDSDMDHLIQEIINTVNNKKAEMEKQLSRKRR